MNGAARGWRLCFRATIPEGQKHINVSKQRVTWAVKL